MSPFSFLKSVSVFFSRFVYFLAIPLTLAALISKHSPHCNLKKCAAIIMRKLDFFYIIFSPHTTPSDISNFWCVCWTVNIAILYFYLLSFSLFPDSTLTSRANSFYFTTTVLMMWHDNSKKGTHTISYHHLVLIWEN